MRWFLVALVVGCGEVETEACDPCEAAQSHAQCIAGWDAVLDGEVGCEAQGSPSYRLGVALGCADIDGPAEGP